MNVRYVPGERTFFRGIRRLPPGHVLEVADGELAPVPVRDGRLGRPTRRLRLADWTRRDPPPLRQAVTSASCCRTCRVGVSLSGGIDSSSIVAMLRQSGTGTIKTFSLGFGEPTDELDDARFVAETYGTDHHEVVLHEPALKHLRRRHPPHRGAEGQLAPALPAPPLHRRARQGGALRSGRRRAVRGLRHLRLPGPYRAAPAGPRRDGAPASRARAGLGRPAWCGARTAAARPRRPPGSSGWRPPATRPATTCCCATPGTSTRRCSGGCTRPTSSSG